MKNLVSIMVGAGFLALQGCAVSADSNDVGSAEEVGSQQAAITAGSATLTYTSDWGTGYCANIAITNALGQATTRWQVIVDLKTTTTTSVFNTAMNATTGRATAIPMNYNTSIAAGATVNFGFCANAPSASVRPTILAWNMESNAYVTCPTASGINPAKAALAVAMGKELGRWTPNADLVVTNGKVVLKSGVTCLSNSCANTKAILGQQDFTPDQNLFNNTSYSQDLQSSFGRQTNLIADLTQNHPTQLPPAHKLTLVGGPTNMGNGSCGPHYIFQVDNTNGTALTSAQAANMANALCFYGQGSCGGNSYLSFMPQVSGNGCPTGRTCVAIDPTDGDNGSTSTTSAGSAPSYPMNRVYNPDNTLFNAACITTAGALKMLQSKCAATASTCGYLYCM